MTNQSNSQPRQSTLLYTAEEASWQDLNRIFIFFISLGAGFVTATVYLALFLNYIYIKISSPAGTSLWEKQSRSGQITLVVIGFIVLVIPIVLEILGQRLIARVSENFTRTFYAIADDINVGRLVRRRAFGVPPMPSFLSNLITYPFILVTKDKLDDKFTWAYSLGGPAKLIIYDGYAVYLERGGNFSRVVGSGIEFMDRFETVRDIIEIRPIIKEMKVDSWTKDGIKLTISIRLECQILPPKPSEKAQGGDASQESEKRIYPPNKKAVQAAVETASVRLNQEGQPEKYDWVAGICGNIEGHIRAHVFGNTINNLLRAEIIDSSLPEAAMQQAQKDEKGKKTLQLLSTEFRDFIQERVNNDIGRLGARLINIQIVKVDKSPTVDSQWVKNWSAEWKSQNAIMKGEAEAYKIRSQEKARAEAQKDMILAIAKRLEKMDVNQMREPLLLSLSGMLENSLVDPYVRASLPKEAMETLEILQNFLQDKK